MGPGGGDRWEGERERKKERERKSLGEIESEEEKGREREIKRECVQKRMGECSLDMYRVCARERGREM